MTIHIHKSVTIALAMAGIFLTFSLNADPVSARGNKRGPHGGPPPEAYCACEGKSEGDTASFKSPMGDTVTGICVLDRDGERLVLEPDNPPDRNGKGYDKPGTIEK